MLRLLLAAAALLAARVRAQQCVNNATAACNADGSGACVTMSQRQPPAEMQGRRSHQAR